MSRLGSASFSLWDWVSRRASRASSLLLIGAGLATACGEEAPPEELEKSKIGKVTLASHAVSCPAPSASSQCTLTPTADTTVYLSHANDYGGAREMCVGTD